MLARKNLSFSAVMTFTGFHIIWLTAWFALVAVVYQYTHWKLMNIPFLPLSLIGTAVAFYIGFKNNQAYDRTWEARKVWGSMINSSRAWGSMVKAYISNLSATEKLSELELETIKTRLMYRHIAYLYALRSQLLIPAPWEHANQGFHIGATAQKRAKEFGVGLYEDNITEDNLKKYLDAEEYRQFLTYSNTATQIIDKQAQDLAALNATGAIDSYRQVELQKILNDFYDHQGKVERIKKFPLPRQYGNMSFLFVCLFIFLLPFGIVSEFAKMGEVAFWLSVPFGALVGWVYVAMELIGDYSENPFEGMSNDTPMYSICRTIEIDLLEMLGERDIPKPVEIRNGVLM